MLETLQTIVIALVTFAIVVAVHEYGHFWVARFNNVKVLRFSIGFGRPLIRWRGADDTEYVIAVLPLGGYVRMADEREDEVDAIDIPRTHNRQSVACRMAIAVAGPMANFFLAVAVLWVLFFRGEMGVVPLIDSVAEGSLAQVAGLEAGQEILAIDSRPTPTVARAAWRPEVPDAVATACAEPVASATIVSKRSTKGPTLDTKFVSTHSWR